MRCRVFLYSQTRLPFPLDMCHIPLPSLPSIASNPKFPPDARVRDKSPKFGHSFPLQASPVPNICMNQLNPERASYAAHDITPAYSTSSLISLRFWTKPTRRTESKIGSRSCRATVGGKGSIHYSHTVCDLIGQPCTRLISNLVAFLKSSPTKSNHTVGQARDNIVMENVGTIDDFCHSDGVVSSGTAPKVYLL